MKTMRKSLLIIALVLTVCVAFCVASFVSYAEELTVTVTQTNGTDVDLVNGKNTLSDDDNGVLTFDKANKTLTLNGVDAKKITVNGTLNLVVEGENTLTTDGEGALDVVTGDLTVNGTGTLTLSAAHSTVYVREGTYTQSGATVNPTATTGNSSNYAYTLKAENGVSISGGTFTGYTTLNYGIYSTNGVISVSGGTVSSTSKANAFQGVGIDISGGKITATSSASDTGFRATGKAGIKISDGEVTVSTKGTGIQSQGDGDIVISGGTLTVTCTSNAIWSRAAGSIYLKGGDITVNGTGYSVRTASGDIFISGGDIDLIQPKNGNAIYSAGAVTISGGTLDVTCTTDGIKAVGGGITVTGGHTVITGTGEGMIRPQGGSFVMRGGYFEVSGTTNVLITANGNSVNLSGGTLKLTASTGGCINSAKNITISEGNDPKLILNAPNSYAMRLNVSSTSFSMTDGTVTGSSKYFLFVKDTKCSFTMGADVVLDYTVTDTFLNNATPDTFTLDSGIVWEEGKELTSSTTNASVKSTLDGKYIFIDSVEELLKIGVDEAYPLSGSYRLTTDLDLSEIEWKPLGAFSGIFDGRGYIIHNMHLGTKDTPYNYGATAYSWGLFSSLTGTVKNLGFADVLFNVTSTCTSNAAAGAVVAYIKPNGRIDNVAVLSGMLKGTVKHQLGIAGISGGTGSSDTGWVISNCYNNADIIAITNTNGTGSYAVAAGIIARAWNKSGNTVKNCFNMGTITAIDNGSKATTYSLAGNIISAQGMSNTTGSRSVTRSNNYAATGLLFFEGDPAGILQDDLNKTTLVDPLGALNPSVSFSGLGSKWVVKTPDGNDYYPILSTFENYAEPVVVNDELIADITAKIETALDGLMVTNNLVPTDVTGMFTDFAPTAKATLTLVEKADLDKAGSWELTVTLSNGTEIKRTLVIDQLPNVKNVDYDFALDVAGIGQGTVTVTLNQDAVAGKYIKALYWGNEDGILEGYSALAIDSTISCVDDTLVFDAPDRLFIPIDATRVYVTLDGITAGSYQIPNDQRSNLGTEKYTFGVISDVHFGYAQAPGSFAAAMDDFKANNVAFVVAAGDFTSAGVQSQYDIFKSSYANYSDIPLFTTVGNHDTLDWNVAETLTTKTAILNMMANVETFANESYTGKNGEFKVENSDAYGEYVYDYTVTYGDDLFIYLGIGPNEIEKGLENTEGKEKIARYVTEAQLNWLKGVLANSEDYQNVILMFHYPLKQSGISLGDKTETFDELSDVLKDYPNVIHFSGHTHYSFTSLNVGTILSQTQKFVNENGTYVPAENDLGYTAVHIPSNYDKQTGYVATVYESGTLLTGYDFANDQAISYATFFVANEEPDAEPTSATIDATVTLADKALKTDDFEFVLMDGEEVLQTVKNDAEGKITFAAIEFTKPGVYTYTVKQTKGNTPGVTYDETAVTVTVTVVKEDGKLVATVSTTPAFKNQYKVPFAEDGVIDGDYFKVDGVPTEMGLFELDGAYYYAQYDGKIIKSQKYYVWKLSTNCGDMTEGWYAFDAEGKVVENGMFTDAEGTTWYYENYAPKEKGLFKYGDNYYVAQYDGKIITSKSYEYNKVGGKYYVWLVDDTATDIGKGWRYFDENGLMLQGIQEHPEKGGKYYFVNGQAKEKGLFYYEGDNNYYVAQYDGKIITNSKYYVWLVDGSAETIGKGWRYFDENGLMLQGIQDHPEKEGKYYFVNGQPKEMGLFLNEADGFYYVAQYDGKIITANNYETAGVKGKYYVWKTTGCDHLKGWQIFNAEGQMIVK